VDLVFTLLKLARAFLCAYKVRGPIAKTLVGHSKKPSRKPDVQKLLGKLAAEEERFLQQDFLAPALRGGEIQVRVAGVVCRIHFEPRDFEGWGIFQPVSHTEAKLARPASLLERRSYLALFPKVRLIVCRRNAGECLCSTASFGDERFQVDGLVPVHLATDVQVFDCIQSRYDGSRFWFEELDSRAAPASAAYLRTAIAQPLAPESLDRHGLSAEERAAYELNYWQLVRPMDAKALAQGARDATLSRLRENLSHAGAQLIDYLERGDSFRVTYRIGRRQYTSAISKDDLSVQVAGICLSGEDQKFDLASLVGVLREAEGGRRVIRVGEHGIDEEHYWRVHPPRNP